MQRIHIHYGRRAVCGEQRVAMIADRGDAQLTSTLTFSKSTALNQAIGISRPPMIWLSAQLGSSALMQKQPFDE